jgi:hypothetical protein
MLHATHIAKETDEQNVKFYTDNFPKVQLVVCDKCKNELCLWYLDPQAPDTNSHHDGMRRVTLSGWLMSSRKRFDGRMGYECYCDNNSILATVEEGIVPQLKGDQLGSPEALQSLDVYPHHEAAVRLVMARDGDKAKVKKLKGGDYSVDGFTHRRLK